MNALQEARPGRVLGGLAEFGGRRDEPLPGRAATVRAILDEIKHGTGIEHPPEWWRDRAIGFVEDAIRHGAPAGRCRELAAQFLGRTHVRLDQLERGLWAWAFGRLEAPPLYCLGLLEDLSDTAQALWELTDEAWHHG